MMIKRLSSLLCKSTFFFFTSCQLLAPYKGPVTPTPDQWKAPYSPSNAGQLGVPSQWKSETSNQESETCHEDVCKELDNWWEIFNDPALNQLEEHALASSYTLWAALERVVQARDQARISQAARWPSIGFNPSFTRTGSLFENPFPTNLLGGLAGAGGNTQPGNMAVGSGSSSSSGGAAGSTPSIPSAFYFVQTQYLIPFNLSYEVDLWGQLYNTYMAAMMRYQASSQAYLSVLLSLTSDVASNYFLLRSLDSQEKVLQETIEARKIDYEINSLRFKAGLISYIDVSRAELELARAKSDRDDVRRLRGIQENIIATLVGVPAPIFSLEYSPLVGLPPVIPAGLPSELLCRRPDIAESERNLAAAYREIGVAYANFFPSLNLSAALGVASPFADGLFSWHARYWQVAASVMQTVFDAGRNCANYDYYKARFREAMANYQQKVLTAFQETEDAFVNLREYANRADDLAVAVRAARQTLNLAQMRYNRGLTNYLDVTDAERNLLTTEQNSAIVLGNRFISTVALIRALGGGWGPCETCQNEECDVPDALYSSEESDRENS